LTVSETSRKDIERLVPGSAGKIMVTPNACPPWIESMEPATARARLHELGITDPYVLTVSTRWPRKNMELAVEAMARLPEEIPHRLILTGKGGWGEGAAGRRGKAVGYVDHATLSALYAGADLYLCPSRHEGFGIPLLEAFRARCPVLCSAGGALPEVSGDAAAIEPSWEPQAWADRIASLLNDPGTLDLMRRRGVAREMEFTWAETARRTLEVYRRVARA
jgi:alpha-1,3-rhamnosyl/mannosyltransferase